MSSKLTLKPPQYGAKPTMRNTDARLQVELRHLKQIVAICRTGGFGGAARQLHIAQPTLSKSIALLEERLGVQLFDREAGYARPTGYGQLIAEHAEIMLKNAEVLQRDIEQAIESKAGKLRIGVGPITRLRPLPQVMDRVSVEYPRLQIETAQESADDLMESLQTKRYHLVFCYFGSASRYGEFMRTKIYENRLVAAVRPEHPVLRAAPLSDRQLLQHPNARLRLGGEDRRRLGAVNSEGRRNLDAFVSDDTDLIKRKPIGTDFIARGPQLIFEEAFENGTLVEVPRIRAPVYECWMLTTPAYWRLPVVKAIAAMAKARTPGRPRRNNS